MATLQPTADSPASTSGTPRKPEQMSREDLLKYSKKQMVLLQKLKAKCDDLQSKHHAHANYNEIKEENGNFQKQIKVLSVENDQLKQTEKELQSTKGSLAEELECVNMKQETLLSSLQCLQDEQKKAYEASQMQNETTELAKEQLGNLQQKHKEVLNEREDLSAQLEDKAQQLVALKGHIKNLTKDTQMLQEANEVLTKENTNIKNELSAVKISLDLFKGQQQSHKKVDEFHEKIKMLSQELDLLKSEHAKVEAHNGKLEEHKASSEKKLANFDEKIKSLQGDLDKSYENNQQLEDELSGEKIELEKRTAEFKQLEQQSDTKNKEHETLILTLQQEKEALTQSLSELNDWKAALDNELTKSRHDFENQLSQHAHVLETKEKEHFELNQKFSETAAELKEVITKETESSAALGVAKTEMALLKSQLDQLEQQQSEMKKNFETQTVDHEGDDTALQEQDLENIRVMFENEIVRFKRNVALTSSMESLDQMLKSFSSECDKTANSVSDLSSTDTEATCEKMNIFGEMIKSLRKVHDEAAHHNLNLLQSLKEEKSELEKQLTLQTEEVNCMVHEKENIRHELHKLTEQFKLLAEEKRNLEKAREELSVVVNSLRNQVTDLEQQRATDAELLSKQMTEIEQNNNSEEVIKVLHEKLHSCETENRKNVENFTVKSDESAFKIETLLKQNEDLNTQLSDSVAKVQEYDAIISQLREKLQSGEDSNTAVVHALENEKVSLKKENDQLKDELSMLEEKSSSALKDCTTGESVFKEKLVVSEQAISELKMVVLNLESRERENVLQVEQLTVDCTQLKEAIANWEEKYEHSQHLVHESEKQVVQLKSEVDSSGAEIVHLKEENKCKESEKVDLQREKESFQERLNSMMAQHSDLLESTEKSGKASEEQHAKLFESHQQVEQLELSLSDCKAKLVHVETEKQSLADQIGELEISQCAIQKTNEEKFRTVEQLNADICSLTSENKSHLEKIGQLEEQIKILDGEFAAKKKGNLQGISELQQQMDKLTSDYDNELLSQKEKYVELNEKFTVAESQLHELKQELTQATDKTGQRDVLLVETADTLKNCEVNLQNAKSSNQELQTQVETYREECEELRQQVVSMETVKEQVLVKSSADTAQEIGVLQKSIKEKEVYVAKLKTLAVKARKELEATKQQLQGSEEENAQLKTKLSAMDSQLQGSQTQASNVQMMQLECDKLQDKVDLVEEEKQAMQKNLEDVFSQLTVVQTEKQELTFKLNGVLTDLETIKKEKSDVETMLASSKATAASVEKEKNVLISEKASVNQELDAARIQLSTLSKQVGEKDKKLEENVQSLKDAHINVQKHDLMSLEMAEYEKTIADLQSRVRELESEVETQKEEISSLDEKLSTLRNENRSVESLRVDAEDRVSKTKEMLDEARDQANRLQIIETELQAQIESFGSQLEAQQQENEQQKLELAARSSECREYQEQIDSLRTSSSRTIDVLERKIKSYQVDMNSLKLEKENLAADYENYKIRVHSVLKQQKNKEAQQPVDQPDKAEILQLRQKISQLQNKLLETQNVMTSREGELDLLQGDYDRLLRQQQQTSESSLEREGRWKTRVKSLQQELLTQRKQYTELQQKLTQQNELVSDSVSKELSNLKDEHTKQIESLKSEIARKDNEINSMQNEVQRISETKKATAPRKPQLPSPLPLLRHPSYPLSEVSHQTGVVDYRSMAREDGEGEENPDNSSIISFEQVLNAPTITSVTEVSETASVSSEVALKQLEAKHEAQSRQLEHISEVARENEDTSARLADQNKVLKDEIRRLEKNQEREQSVANLEYLKNVVYKFITLPPSDERQHLLPVIDTMLKLSGDERQTLQTIATGNDDTEQQDSSGWGSYLQRWSGMQ